MKWNVFHVHWCRSLLRGVNGFHQPYTWLWIYFIHLIPSIPKLELIMCWRRSNPDNFVFNLAKCLIHRPFSTNSTEEANEWDEKQPLKLEGLFECWFTISSCSYLFNFFLLSCGAWQWLYRFVGLMVAISRLVSVYFVNNNMP